MRGKFLISVEGHLDKEIILCIVDRICILSDFALNRSNFLIRRAGGNSQVIKNIRGHDDHCIGIIDEDKEKPKDYDKFEECYHNPNLSFMEKHNRHYKYLIVVKPAPERWLDNCAAEAGFGRTDFGLPDDFKRYRKLCKKSKLPAEVKEYAKEVISSSSTSVNLLIKGVGKIYSYHNN